MIKRFTRENERAIAELGAYWDARVLDQIADISQKPIAPEMIATVESIHDADDALRATPAFRARLLAHLLDAPDLTESTGLRAPLEVLSLPVPLPRPVLIVERSRRSRLWAVASAGSMLVIVLAIVVGIVLWNTSRKPEPALIPLRSQSTGSGVMMQTLLEEAVPAGTLSGELSKWIATFKFALEPGEAWRDAPVGCPLSRQYVVGLIESGTLAMINAGSFEVTRSDGTREAIPAGQRADLHAGDSWVYFADRTETNVQKWNPGSEPMVAYQTDWALDASCESTPGNPEWIWHQSDFGHEFDPSRPMAVTIEQSFIPAGTVLTREEATSIGFFESDEDIFRVIGIESGTLEETWLPDDLAESEMVGSAPRRQNTWAAGTAWSNVNNAAPEGQEVELRVTEDEPVLLTSFAWSYDDAGELSSMPEP